MSQHTNIETLIKDWINIPARKKREMRVRECVISLAGVSCREQLQMQSLVCLYALGRIAETVACDMCTKLCELKQDPALWHMCLPDDFVGPLGRGDTGALGRGA